MIDLKCKWCGLESHYFVQVNRECKGCSALKFRIERDLPTAQKILNHLISKREFNSKTEQHIL